MRLSDRFFTFYAQGILAYLHKHDYKKKPSITVIQEEFRGTYNNMWLVVKFLAEKKLVKIEKYKNSSLLSLTDKGKIIAKHLSLAIGEYKNGK